MTTTTEATIRTGRTTGRLAWPNWWPAALWALVALALRLFRLGGESLWFDEAYSIWVAQGPMWDPATLLEWKVPFPTYYALLHGWIKLFGAGPVALRLLSVVAGVLSVALLWRLVARHFGGRAAFWAAGLLALSPLHLWYSQEGRQYALALLFTILTADALLAAMRPGARRASFAAFALWGALALYTHYYVGLVLASWGLWGAWVAWRRRSWPLFGALAAANGGILLLFLPGLVAPLSQAGGGTWNWVAAKYGIPGPRQLYDLAGAFTFGTLFDPATPLKLLWLAVSGALVLAAVAPGPATDDRRREGGAFLAAWAFGAPIGAFLISQLTPLFLTRYLLPALPGYLALLGVGLARAAGWWPRLRLLAAALLIASLVALLPTYAGGLKEDWRGVAAAVQAAERSGDLVLLVDEDTSVPFNYYYRGNAPQYRLWRGWSDPADIAARLDPVLAGPRRAWLVHSHAPGAAAKQWLLARPGLRLAGQWEYQGIELLLFEVGE